MDQFSSLLQRLQPDKEQQNARGGQDEADREAQKANRFNPAKYA